MKTTRLNNVLLTLITINLTLLTLSEFKVFNLLLEESEIKKKEKVEIDIPYIAVHDGKLYYWGTPSSVDAWAHHNMRKKGIKKREYGGVYPVIFSLPSY